MVMGCVAARPAWLGSAARWPRIALPLSPGSGRTVPGGARRGPFGQTQGW